MLDKDFWKDKKVFITGHTGFKGSWVSMVLYELGAKIYGYSLTPNTNPSMYQVCNINEIISYNRIEDILNIDVLNNTLQKIHPHIVIHLAAQPLVSDSYLDPMYTFHTNIMGTVKVLEACRKISSIQAIEIITSDKCYKVTKNIGYVENDPLGGRDPYSASKACAEIVVESYRESFFKHIPVVTARAGNVIGGGDWATGRLITDALESIKNKIPLQLRNPGAIRPWQHVLDVIYGYLRLLEYSVKYGTHFSGAWNFGPTNSTATVSECISKFFDWYGKGTWIALNHLNKIAETQILMLDCTKARKALGWEPKYNLDQNIQLTVDWYKRFYAGGFMRGLTVSQIRDYFKN